ncbi:hypothetical protein [Cupriavidus numazuensis]|uniref:Phage protein n=1 Tax=Cupriavidus numazuensis TaxID=221992 RepID=A0ABN7PU20_9BURK|nr:hypothetical protein [Cupriavidus numazuensis]CAG2132492.1 hypothetical protein LMG26411_00627 [Cupriavidus numazuensis]
MQIDLNDPEALLKAFADAESGKDIAPESAAADTGAAEAEAAKAAQEAAEVAAAAEAAKAKETSQGAAGDSTQDDESKAEGVLARDGKNVIPYSVLRGERERAARAEQLAKDAEAQIADLKAQLAAGNQGATPGESARTTGAATEAEALSDEELEAIREDFPTMYKALKAQQATLAALQTKLQPVEQEREQRVRTEAEEREIAIRDAIDATPKLAHIQANDPKLFAAAQRFDTVLRQDPDWAGKTLAERFAHVVTLIETTHGAIEIPGAKQSPPQKTPEELKKEAEAAAKTSAKPSVPTSLSDFPAGSPPAASEQDALEKMTHAQIADKFARMTPDQMEAYLNSIQ